MDEERKKAKKLAFVLFFSCLCIALACFAGFAYLAFTTRGAGPVDDRIVTISKIIVMTGIFFLTLAFGYLLPALLSHKKRKRKKGGPDMPEIFDEANMRQVLGKYIPDRETLLAGIHAVAKETSVTGVFGKCMRMEDGLVPDEKGGVIVLNKKKYSTYDVYLGVTQSFLVMAECEKNSYYYQFDSEPDVGKADIQELAAPILFADIGTCFPLTDMQSCEIKNGWMGSVKCFITMKNGSYFKLILPKLGGLGGGMPHHTEYRAAIISRLTGSGV
ncbi:MAG: hypothetical protein HFE86_00900 [Clostridiales bacterium]|nr:hypothetical protein [Clostridiales bacterium]